jgi:leader peptidase (prepilin peptidase) / N-methyltransferase
MNMVVIVAGAAAGLAAGLTLRGEVVRLSVPGGAPEETSCGSCAASLPSWPALRCACCGHWLGAPLAIELTTAALVAVLLARFGGQPAAAAFGYLGVIGVALSQIDGAVQRLPDRLTLPAYPALILLLAVAAAAGHNWPAFGRALLGGLALGAGYLLLAILSRGQVGGGDIKLAGLAGLVLGWLSWHTLLAGAFAGFLLAGLASAALLVARRISRRSKVSFGPYLLGGAFLALIASTAGR